MPKLTLAFAAWIAANVILVGVILVFSRQLPDPVAIHFNLSGAADNSISRTSHLVFSLLMGCGIPGLIVGVSFALKNGSPDLLNVPNPEYWRSPENFPRACRLLLRSVLWLSTGLCLWFAAFNFLLVSANMITPARLPRLGFVALLGGLFLFLAGWIISLYQSFRVPPKSDPSLPVGA